jgi:hypothetical protein
MKEDERRAITMHLVGLPLTDAQIDVAEEAAAKILARTFTMKLCKDCKHRKFTFTRSWVCRAGSHIPNEEVTDPVSGRVGPRYSGFSDTKFPRCEYMRQKDHSFVLHQCGPLGGMWEAKK